MTDKNIIETARQRRGNQCRLGTTVAVFRSTTTPTETTVSPPEIVIVAQLGTIPVVRSPDLRTSESASDFDRQVFGQYPTWKCFVMRALECELKPSWEVPSSCEGFFLVTNVSPDCQICTFFTRGSNIPFGCEDAEFCSRTQVMHSLLAARPNLLPYREQVRRTAKTLWSCPTTGDGVRRWLFEAAVRLHPYFGHNNDLADLLMAATAHCRPEVPEDEVQKAFRKGRRFVDDSNRGLHYERRWPERHEWLIQAIARDGQNLAALAASSPVKWQDDTPHTEEVVDALFPGNSLLCAAPRHFDSYTRPREEWRGLLERQQFIVPNPMTDKYGDSRDGVSSRRTLANTGPRRFVVVEFDTGTVDQHAAILRHLGDYAPLVLVVHSGNKSLAGWFLCAGEPEAAIENFFRYAVSLGADPATWILCQLVRTPGGLRDSGHRQRVVYFDPGAITSGRTENA